MCHFELQSLMYNLVYNGDIRHYLKIMTSFDNVTITIYDRTADLFPRAHAIFDLE